jgi:hypothetical protein
MLRIIAGCVGTTKVNNMDIQYAQAVFTPSDFAFPSNGIKADNPNTEMTLIVDVDINLLKHCTNTAASTP